MNVNQYLNHIQIDIDQFKDPTELLKQIHRHHLLHVPFENLDIHYGRPLSMEPETIMKKVVEQNRGGLCFETNSLLYWVLNQLGYKVELISARFWNGEKQDWNPECSHLALLVQLEQPYLVDVGIGGGFIYPIPIQIGTLYSDQSGIYRITQPLDTEKNWYVLQKQQNEEWTDLFGFSTISRRLEEFEEMCIYHQTSPESMFTQKKICSRLTENGRISLSEECLTITIEDEKMKRLIQSEQEWKDKLQQYFQIVL